MSFDPLLATFLSFCPTFSPLDSSSLFTPHCPAVNPIFSRSSSSSHSANPIALLPNPSSASLPSPILSPLRPTHTIMAQDAVADYEYEALPENSSLYASLLAGAFAGIAEHAIMYPVDSIKVEDH